MLHEAQLVGTLVEMADTLVDEFDVVELLTLLTDRCVELLGVSAAGVMLLSPEGELRVVASSSETMRMVELFELQAQEGPCPDCYRTGEAVVSGDLTEAGAIWPRFAPVALGAGFRSVQALPMRLRRDVIGAVNLFGKKEGMLDESDVLAARALADMATIAILQHRCTRQAQIINEQLTHALNCRVVIEQAKGVLAERTGVNMELAFSRLRNYARSHNLRLADVARTLVEGTLAASSLGTSSAGAEGP